MRFVKSIVYYWIECEKGELEEIKTEFDDFIKTDTPYKPVQIDVAIYLKAYIEFLAYQKGLYNEENKQVLYDVVDRYSDILNYVKDKINKEHNNIFKGLSLKDCIFKEVSYKDLHNKYNYDLTSNALEADKVILIDKEEVESRKTKKFFEKHALDVDIEQPTAEELTKLTLVDMLECFELALTVLINSNKAVDLLAEFTGLEDLKDVKPDTSDYEGGFITMIRQVDSIVNKYDTYNAEQKEVVKTLFFDSWKRIMNPEYKLADEALLDKCRKLLRSGKSFKDIKSQFYFSMIRGSYENS